MPKYGKEKFLCPHCSVVSQQEWFDRLLVSSTASHLLKYLFYNHRIEFEGYEQSIINRFVEKISSELSSGIKDCVPLDFGVSTCLSCENIALWKNKNIVHPKIRLVNLPNEDLDEDIKELYIEASIILNDSPKGSTAILRLALQKLMKQIGQNGSDLNQDIKNLVAQGLNIKIQKALDLLRVVGNHAVHPGQIDFDDDSEIALKLFSILNFIADELISKPKQLESIYENVIPENTKEHIKKRDAKH